MIRNNLFAERFTDDIYRMEIEELDLKKWETRTLLILSTSVPVPPWSDTLWKRIH